MQRNSFATPPPLMHQQLAELRARPDAREAINCWLYLANQAGWSTRQLGALLGVSGARISQRMPLALTSLGKVPVPTPPPPPSPGSTTKRAHPLPPEARIRLITLYHEAQARPARLRGPQLRAFAQYAAMLYQEGFTLRSIAKAVGLTAEGIRVRLASEGLWVSGSASAHNEAPEDAATEPLDGSW